MHIQVKDCFWLIEQASDNQSIKWVGGLVIVWVILKHPYFVGEGCLKTQNT